MPGGRGLVRSHRLLGPAAGAGAPVDGDSHRPGIIATLSPMAGDARSAAGTVERLGRAIPFGLWVTGALSAIVLVTLTAVRGLTAALAPLSPVLIGIAIALLLTALLSPVTGGLQRLGLRQSLAAATTLVGFVLLIIGIFWLTGAQIATGAKELADGVSHALDSLQDWLRTGPLGINGDELAGYIAQAREWAQDNWSKLASGALQAGRAVSVFGVVLVLSLVSTYFFLAQGRTIWLWHVRLLPRGIQQRVHDAVRRGWVAVRAYARTQIIVAAVDAVGIGLGALVLGLPLVLPIALLTFVMAFIPVVGAVLSGAVAVLIAFASNGITAGVIMLVVVIAVQQIESNVLQPVLMSRAVDLHAWAVIIGVTVFSYVWGVMGALLSVPIMALVKVVVLTLKGHDPYPHLGTDGVPPYREPPAEDSPLDEIPDDIPDVGAAQDA